MSHRSTDDEYGVEQRASRWNTTTTFGRNTYVSREDALIGLYRFVSPFPLFDKPEQYSWTQKHFPLEDAPMAIVTGKVYLENGQKCAIEIITTHNGHPRVCWTVFGILEFVASASQEP